jgi:membrane protease YdiL (CAAX protease family)
VILRTKALLIVEFLAIFVGVPLTLVLTRPVVPPIPVLWLAAGYGFFALYRDPEFPREQLWNPQPLRRNFLPIVLLFAIGAVVLAVLTYEAVPGLPFGFVRTHPLVWAAVMILYPVLSVYPQGILFRAFLLHRYRNLAAPLRQEKWALILLSALAFSLMHIVFRNWIAVVLTFFGGLLFARRHLETRSLFVSSFEHALYGCFVFTIGLGQFFFVRLV